MYLYCKLFQILSMHVQYDHIAFRTTYITMIDKIFILNLIIPGYYSPVCQLFDFNIYIYRISFLLLSLSLLILFKLSIPRT